MNIKDTGNSGRGENKLQIMREEKINKKYVKLHCSFRIFFIKSKLKISSVSGKFFANMVKYYFLAANLF